MCGSTCFGRLPTHHQERTTALGASGFTVGAWWLERCWSWSGRSDRPRPTMLQPLPSNGKTRESECSCMLLIVSGETPETCWATHKRQVINLWNCCILFVQLFESYDDARTCEPQMYKTLSTAWFCTTETQYMKTKTVHDAWNCTDKKGKEYLKPFSSQLRNFLNEQIKQQKFIYRSQCLIRDSSLVYFEWNSPSEDFKLQKKRKNINYCRQCLSLRFMVPCISDNNNK
jgi:hypothetical protein